MVNLSESAFNVDEWVTRRETVKIGIASTRQGDSMLSFIESCLVIDSINT